MATYVNDLRLKEIATGDESGTWGASTNTNLELIAEAFSFGTEAITTNADTHTTTIADGSTDPGRSIYLKYTGTLDSACTITIGPNTVSKLWLIENGTSGSQNIIISQGSGANVTIPAGHVKAVYSDGAGSGAAMVDAFTGLNVAGDFFVGDDLTLLSDASVLGFGTDTDTTLTHVADTGLLLNSTRQLQFGDSGTYIHQSADGVLDLVSDTEIEINATTIDMNGAVDISGTVTATGTSVFASLDISGDIDVDGTTNLDVVDIDGAVDMASTLAVGGVVTANAGVVVDNITIDGTEIDLSSGDLTIDVAGDIILDADGDDIFFTAGGTNFGKITNDSSNLLIRSMIQDKDIVFKGQDAGSVITALTLDMSAAGAATFNDAITLKNTLSISSSNTSAFLQASDNVLQFGTSSDDPVVFFENNAEKMRLTSGNLGIGTSSPAVALDIAGSSTTQMRIQMSGQADTRVLSDTGTGIVGTYSNHPLTIKTNSSTVATFDASGNLGIGITSPQKALDIAGASTSGGGVMRLSGTGNASQGDVTGAIQFHNADDTDNTAGVFGIIRGVAGASGGEGDIQILTDMPSEGADASTVAMHISSTAKVGIGTTSPSAFLTLTGSEGSQYAGSFSNTSAQGWGLFVQAGADNDDYSFRIRNKDATDIFAVKSGGRVGIGETDPDNLLHLKSSDDTLLKLESTDATVRLALTDNGGTSQIKNTDGTLILEADPSDATSSTYLGFEVDGTERARILSGGHFLMGTTTNQGVGGISFQETATGVNIQQNMDGTSGGAELYVFRRNSTQIGSINQSSTNAVTYNTSSDARLKDVTGSARGLDVINNLNPVAYNWKADNHADEGLIAQEVEELVPNAVNQDEDGYYSMDYSKLVTHLVKGMQEQQEQIESLKSEIASLKEK